MSKVKLAIRIRPFTDKELKSEKDRDAVVCVSDEHTITITNIKVNTSGAGDSRERTRNYYAEYTFNSVVQNTLQPYATQEKVFESVGQGVLASLAEGLSTCVLAYGQSATGKTYTMMGTDAKPGLIPRICQALGTEYPSDIKVSFLEIYNEKVHDLLACDVVSTLNSFSSLPRRKGNARKDLRVREHPTKGPYVQNLRRVSVSDAAALLSLVTEGARRRRTASTRRNAVSSRSHALLELCTPRATLHLADLAGSEKASWDGCGGGRQKEGANINKSLVALSNVISALAVSPSFACYNESASTLRWAAQVRQLQSPKIVQSPGIITKAALQSQLTQLLSELGRHYIRYVPESGRITYDDDHWTLKPKVNVEIDSPQETTGNIMNTPNPKSINQNAESKSSAVSSENVEAINPFNNSTTIVNEINKEMDKLFGPSLPPRSGSALELVAPIRHKKRHYSSQEVLPVDLSYKGDIGSQSSEKINNETKFEDAYCSSSSKAAKVPILYDNHRAEIVASVTERLYSKFKKDAAANKMESMVEKKIMQPLSELRICTNARQRLMELSQRAIRNKRRIGIPAHTQTRRMVIRVKDQGINVQTDLEAFIVRKNNTEVLYRDAATETDPITPRYKDIAVGNASLKFHDRATTMDRTDTESASVMTEIITNNNISTQTQVIPPPRHKKGSHKRQKGYCDKHELDDKCSTPPVININISPFYSLDSESLGSSDDSENGYVENSSNLGITPDLLTNHNSTDSSNEQKQTVVKDISALKIKNKLVNQDYDKVDEDFPHEETCVLPRVSVDPTNTVDRNDIKNMILGRDKNAYPYNIKLSPLRNCNESKRVIKFKDDLKPESEEFEKSNQSDVDSCEGVCMNNVIDYLDDYDSSNSTNIGSDFVYSKGGSCDYAYTMGSNNRDYKLVPNKDTQKCSKQTCDCDKKNIETRSLTNSYRGPELREYHTERKQGNKKKIDTCRCNNFECMENDILQTCDKLEKVTGDYKNYLKKYCYENKNINARSPTEYLQYLVQLRRKVVRESHSTSSTGDLSSN